MKKGIRPLVFLILAAGLLIWALGKKRPAVTKEIQNSEHSESARPEDARPERNEKIEGTKAASSQSNTVIAQVAPNSQPNAAAEPSNVKVSRQKFIDFAKKSLKTLPRASDLKNLKAKDAHETPAVLISKSGSLADIAQMISDNPDLEPEASSYYKKCAGEKDIIMQIRARCLSHYKRLATKHGETVDLSIYPKNLLDLADFIP